MPHDIAYRRTKIGFNSPIVDWMRGPLKPYFMDTLGSRAFNECPLVDAPRARSLVNHVMDDPQATFKSGERAWWSILPYLWSQAFLQGAGQGGLPTAVRQAVPA
jgi:asparagine synthase (glutamine-hydrolysing)